MKILIISGSPRKGGNTELFDAILTEYNLCLNFFNIEDAGKVLVRGVKDKGDIKGTRFLDDAYQLGTSI